MAFYYHLRVTSVLFKKRWMGTAGNYIAETTPPRNGKISFRKIKNDVS